MPAGHKNHRPAVGTHNATGHSPQAAPARLVLFDFDGTLVRGDNGTRMILSFARSRTWPLVLMLAATPVIMPLLLFPPSKRIGVSMYLWLSTVGMDKRQINRCLKHLANHTASHPQLYRIDPVWDRLDAHMAAGDKIVIVTGCWEKLTKKILKRMGLKTVKVIGSRKKRWLGGYISQPHCYGKHKLTCLAREGFTPPWSCVYTDSVSDRYLLQHAETPIVVQPSRYSLLRVRRLFGDVEVIR